MCLITLQEVVVKVKVSSDDLQYIMLMILVDLSVVTYKKVTLEEAKEAA